jgi:hypothetical protein
MLKWKKDGDYWTAESDDRKDYDWTIATHIVGKRVWYELTSEVFSDGPQAFHTLDAAKKVAQLIEDG